MFEKLYKSKLLARPGHALRNLTNSEKKVNLDFSSNDYLGLGQNATVLQQALKAAQQYGVGASGSRLLSGNSAPIMQLEADIAQGKGTKAALVFSSGFQCNVGVLSTLLDKKMLKTTPLVFFDRCNHASLYQAVFLSQAHLIRYRHNDMQHLSDCLARYARDARPKYIVTETVFGMEGDQAPLDALIAFAQTYNALLYLDEAHATGIYGTQGYGLSGDIQQDQVPMVSMGTFSKALGSSGAYVACDAYMAQYLINFCPSFIYTTAPSPFSIAAAQAAWQCIPHLDAQRRTLVNLGQYARQCLRTLRLNIGTSTTHIIPIIFGSTQKTQHVAQTLLDRGIQVSCVRPPTVPPNTARLRIALTIHHTPQDIDILVRTLQCIL